MRICDILPTQDGLRSLVLVENLIKFIISGGIFDQVSLSAIDNNANLITLNRFEDGQVFIHDGHHRVAAIWLSGVRDVLLPQEITYSDFTYDRYNRANFSNGWYTPFDPRTHVRVPDFFQFRNHIKILSEKDPQQAIEYIKLNKSSYLRDRKLRHNHISGILDFEDVVIEEFYS